MLLHLLTQVAVTSTRSLRWPADGTSAHLLLRKPLILKLSVGNEEHDHIFSLYAFYHHSVWMTFKCEILMQNQHSYSCDESEVVTFSSIL